jgi:uncharacterized protein with ATP-grasp and redox domains
MEPLNPIPQCTDCLLSLAKNTALLESAANPELVEKSEEAARQILADAENGAVSSPQIANQILREVRHLTGVDDPYIEFKAREMALARKVYSQLKSYVGRDLQSRVRLSILGNSLDFFNNPEQALADIPHQFLNEFSFYRDDTGQFEAILEKNPGLVLYLTDNAGEVYFDLPLYEYIRRRSNKTILVVKGGPALNDLTRAELQTAAIEDMLDQVADTGTDGCGIDWENVSQSFRDLMASADLILSKGMANFETLYPREIRAPTLFLLKVKCEPIQNYVQAPMNSFLALWKEGIKLETVRRNASDP